MNKKLGLGLVFVFAAMISGGCASILKGTSQTLTFQSEPDNAQVLIDGKPIGVTPLSVSYKKNAAQTVMIKKDGYRTQTMPLEKKYDGVALLNIFWDLSTTDFITGAAYEYVPNTYYFILKENSE